MQFPRSLFYKKEGFTKSAKLFSKKIKFSQNVFKNTFDFRM